MLACCRLCTSIVAACAEDISEMTAALYSPCNGQCKVVPANCSTDMADMLTAQHTCNINARLQSNSFVIHWPLACQSLCTWNITGASGFATNMVHHVDATAAMQAFCACRQTHTCPEPLRFSAHLPWVYSQCWLQAPHCLECPCSLYCSVHWLCCASSGQTLQHRMAYL